MSTINKPRGRITLSPERMYEVILSPVITEKATLASEHNQVVFRVPIDATKPEIRAAVEGLFKVKVVGINTLTQKGKVKMWRGVRGRRSDTKKAIVRLAEGESIDVTTGV
jgi:large subunit ribosomal protein L23